MPLDTLANVKTRLGITSSSDDTLLALLQDSADKLIDNYCNRDFAGGTYTEYLPGNSAFLHLRNFPIDSVTSVKVDLLHLFGADTLLPSDAYVIHTERGVIQSVSGPFVPVLISCLVNSELRQWMESPRAVQIVYAVLTGQVPNDVKEAYARLIGHWYRKVKTESANNFQNVTQQKFGDAVAVFAPSSGAVPDEVKQLLDLYRTPLV